MVFEYYYIAEAMSDFVPMTDAEIYLYESGEKKKDPLWDKNQGVMINVINLLGKMIRECRKIISSILGTIRNTINYIFLSKEDKKRYRDFCAQVKSDPKLKKEKIKVTDWKKMDKYYQSALRQANGLAEQVANKQITLEQAKKQEKSIIASLSDLTGKCSAIVTVETALRIANGSIEAAKQIEQTLLRDDNAMSQLEAELGSKEVAKFREKVTKLTKETYFRRFRALILQKEQKDIVDTMQDIMKEFQNVGTTKGKIALAVNNKGVATRAAKEWLTNKEFRKDVKAGTKVAKTTVDKVQEIRSQFGI